MHLARRNLLVYALLAAVWALVLGWQIEEHHRVREAAKNDLRNRSKDIAKTVAAFIRVLRFRGTGAVMQERLEPVLTDYVNGWGKELVRSSELLGIKLLNATGDSVAAAGLPIDLEQKELLQRGERWGRNTVTLVNPVDLDPTVVLPPRDFTNNVREGRSPPQPALESRLPEARPPEPTNLLADGNTNGLSNERERSGRDSQGRPRRPPWLRWMDEKDYEALLEKRALHGLVLMMSLDTLEAATTRDLWLRSIIVFLTTLSVVGAGLSWRNLTKSSELEIRLVRASELNTHLKEMNLAAAGLAHETRNPLNIIRGLAQMISKREDAPPEIREKTRGIIDETDKVTAQLNEFINYSRPREVRRSPLALTTVVNEVVRTLNYDLGEKQIQLEVKSDPVTIEADEQLLRQALFNLILNSIQAVNGAGHIDVIAQRSTTSEAMLEVRDNGPGVPAERRGEVFKPYFTTQKHGTGLGLAVVQQIVLAHGWEIQCLANEPQGALFRITHLKLAG